MSAAGVESGLWLRMSVTHRCDLRCCYCRPRRAEPPGDTQSELEPADMVRFVRALGRLGPVRKLRLTGGEPLARADLLDVVTALATCHVPDLAITTNGQQLAECALELRRAGIRRVNISLDSLRAETFRRIAGAGSLARTLAGIEAASRAGFHPIGLNTVVLRGLNDQELPTIARFALERGYQARFIELMPHGVPSADFARCFVGLDEMAERLARELRLRALPVRKGASSRVFRAHGPFGTEGVVGFIAATTRPFCAGCRRLRLTADGRLLGCLGKGEPIDLSAWLRSRDPDADHRIASLASVAFGCKRRDEPLSTVVPLWMVGG